MVQALPSTSRVPEVVSTALVPSKSSVIGWVPSLTLPVMVAGEVELVGGTEAGAGFA